MPFSRVSFPMTSSDLMKYTNINIQWHEEPEAPCCLSATTELIAVVILLTQRNAHMPPKTVYDEAG